MSGKIVTAVEQTIGGRNGAEKREAKAKELDGVVRVGQGTAVLAKTSQSSPEG